MLEKKPCPLHNVFTSYIKVNREIERFPQKFFWEFRKCHTSSCKVEDREKVEKITLKDNFAILRTVMHVGTLHLVIA